MRPRSRDVRGCMYLYVWWHLALSTPLWGELQLGLFWVWTVHSGTKMWWNVCGCAYECMCLVSVPLHRKDVCLYIDRCVVLWHPFFAYTFHKQSLFLTICCIFFPSPEIAFIEMGYAFFLLLLFCSYFSYHFVSTFLHPSIKMVIAFSLFSIHKCYSHRQKKVSHFHSVF